MSRYHLNKVLNEINLYERELAAFKADPAGFVAAWEASGEAAEGESSPRRHPAGGRLSDEERRAVVERDFGALYALGAHPYTLWSWTEAVWCPEVPRPELVRRFREAAARHGHPDFST